MPDLDRRPGNTFYDNPDYYDLVFGFRDIRREVSFICDVCADLKGQTPTDVLDLACGTGEHVLEFARRDMYAVGIDRSPAMIAHSVAKARAHGLDADFVLGNMRHLPFGGSFDCAICMFQSLPLITTNEDLLSHFDGVANCLAPGGVYIIEMGNPRGWIVDQPHGPREVWEERCWNELRDGARIRATTYRDPLDLRHETMKIEMGVDIAAPGISVRLSETEIHRFLLPETLGALALAGGGFSLAAVHGDFSGRLAYDGGIRCARMICVLRKDEPAKKRAPKKPDPKQYGLDLG